MSERTFLQLVQDTVADLGIQGGSGPATLTDLEGEFANIQRWVAEADLYVQMLWLDWDFLWVEDTNTIPIDTHLLIAPASSALIRRVESRSLTLRPGTSTAFVPKYMDWREFRDKYEIRARTTMENPSAWTITPSRQVRLSHDVSANTDYRFEFWKWPQRMTAAGDYSALPGPMDRIIVRKAQMIYAGREDAPEIMTWASAEYADLLEKLEASCLPQNSPSRTQRNDPDAMASISFG